MHSSWTELPRLHHARRAHTLSSLPDGGLVVIGGLAPDGRPIDSIEVLTLGASSWRVAGKLTTARSEHGAVVLLDGRVLAIGGRGDPTEHAPLVSTELFDPKTGLTTAGPPLVVGRYSMHPLLTPNGELWLADGFNDLGTAYPPQRLARGAKSFEETPSTGAAPSTAWIDGEGIVTVESGRSEAIAPIARYKRWLNAGRRPLQPVVAAIDAKSATELPHALPPLGVATSVSLGVDTLLLAQTSAGEWSAFRFEGKRRAFIELAPPPRDLLFTSIVPVPGGAVTCGEDHAWLFDGTAWKELPPPPKGLWNFPVTVTQGSVALVGGYDRNSKNQDHVTDRAAELHWTSTP